MFFLIFGSLEMYDFSKKYLVNKNSMTTLFFFTIKIFQSATTLRLSESRSEKLLEVSDVMMKALVFPYGYERLLLQIKSIWNTFCVCCFAFLLCWRGLHFFWKTTPCYGVWCTFSHVWMISVGWKFSMSRMTWFLCICYDQRNDKTIDTFHFLGLKTWGVCLFLLDPNILKAQNIWSCWGGVTPFAKMKRGFLAAVSTSGGTLRWPRRWEFINLWLGRWGLNIWGWTEDGTTQNTHGNDTLTHMKVAYFDGINVQ